MAQFDKSIETLATLEQIFPQSKNFTIDKSLGLSVPNEKPHVVLVIDFDNEQDWRNYYFDEKHLAMIKSLQPYVDFKNMAVEQFEF
ncbi:Dabb family protein [Lactiplantibacillus mudanjiangensis]|uniref:Stress-response A/B barrel domain-containing protein n=1 Tax=Lactiplantibacillus mudanjiangensis TaxID=1296538 RepID=A0A660E3R6_9LACO|nr:Dabb family protein [Lactiplantibacillus mudanjiangensis]VDG24732.1 hypothetical protein MUDAN_IGPPGNFN_02918 [Lactiplantibacillus mudanjiangensis]VDG29344.1 hypothetical protein MUDAN_MDHGFNIF_03480 [Lactiplantibacillus mudanjiangensis]